MRESRAFVRWRMPFQPFGDTREKGGCVSGVLRRWCGIFFVIQFIFSYVILPAVQNGFLWR